MLKTIRILTSGTHWGLVKSLYFDSVSGWLCPDVCVVDENGTVLFQTNSLRLRGPDIVSNARICVVWGDSVVFSVPGLGWPEMLNEYSSDCVFLNGGVEGASSSTVFQRARQFNQEHDVFLNVVMPGWNPIGGNDLFERELLTAISAIPNLVLATMPTCLNHNMASTDISAKVTGYFGDECVNGLAGMAQGLDVRTIRNQGFTFWGYETYSVSQQQVLFNHIRERNEMIRDVAKISKTKLIDIHNELDTSDLSDFTRDFFDICHPRPSAYPRLAAFVFHQIAPVLAGAGA